MCQLKALWNDYNFQENQLTQIVKMRTIKYVFHTKYSCIQL